MYEFTEKRVVSKNESSLKILKKEKLMHKKAHIHLIMIMLKYS